MIYTRFRSLPTVRLTVSSRIASRYTNVAICNTAELATECALKCTPIPYAVGSFGGKPVYSYKDYNHCDDSHVVTSTREVRTGQTDYGYEHHSDAVSTIDGQWEIAKEYNHQCHLAFKKAKKARHDAISAYHTSKRNAYLAYRKAIENSDRLRAVMIELTIQELRLVRPKVRYWVTSSNIVWETKKRVLDKSTGRYIPASRGVIPLTKVYASKFEYPDLVLPPKPIRPVPIPRRYFIDKTVNNNCNHIKYCDDVAILSESLQPTFVRFQDTFKDSNNMYHRSAVWNYTMPYYVYGIDSQRLLDATWTRDNQIDDICLSVLNHHTRFGLPDPESLLLQLWEMLESVALLKFIYLERRILRNKHPVKRLAEAFLLYSFAIKPLINLYQSLVTHVGDVVEWCANWEMTCHLPEKQRIRRRGSNRLTFYPAIPYVKKCTANSSGYDVSTIYAKKKHLSTEFIAHASVAMQTVSAGAFFSDISHDFKVLPLPDLDGSSINLLDPESVIRYADDVWNAIPFSFLVDMVVNLSDSIANEWNIPPYVDPMQIVRTRRKETTWDIDAGSNIVYGTANRRVYTRDVSTIPYEPIVIPKFKKQDAYKVAIYAALAIVLA